MTDGVLDYKRVPNHVVWPSGTHRNLYMGKVSFLGLLTLQEDEVFRDVRLQKEALRVVCDSLCKPI